MFGGFDLLLSSHQAVCCSFPPLTPEAAAWGPGLGGTRSQSGRSRPTGKQSVARPQGAELGFDQGPPGPWALALTLSLCLQVRAGGLTPEKAKLWGIHGPSSWGIGFPQQSGAGRDTSRESKPRADSAADANLA